MNPRAKSAGPCCFFPAVTAALTALGLISTAQAQLQVAGNLLVNVDATTAPLGPLATITNNGTAGGLFEARGGGVTVPVVTQAYGSGAKGIFFDGGDFMQHVVSAGGALIPADPTLTGVNPTLTIEAWALNPGLAQEETMVAWGHRGNDGQNISFNYGWDAAWGAMGHWAGADMGWDPASSASGVNPLGNPPSGVWHHLVYTFDGTTQKAYSDGVLLNSESISLNIFPTPAILLAAQMADDITVNADLRGRLMLSKVRVHSEALTEAQVLNNYTFESGGYGYLGAPLPFHPSHRYSFNNAAGAATNGVTVLDSEGTANGTIRGAGAMFTGTRVTLPGGASATQAYIDLPNGLLSTNSVDNGGLGEVTIEGWVKVTGARTWSRIFDFGSSDIDPGVAVVGGEVTGAGGGGEGADYLFLSAQDGDNVNRHVIDIRNSDGVPMSDPAGPGFDSGNYNRDYHFAVTWNEATGQIQVFENGAVVDGFSFDPATTKMSHIHDVNVWLGRSNWAGDQNTQGEYDEFRIYPRVLSPDQVRASFLAGPTALATADPASISVEPADTTAPEFGSASFTAAAQGALPIIRSWYKNNTLIPGQTGNTLSLTSIPFSDNNAQFYFVASNNIGGIAYTATSRVATLTVLADTNPPSITQVRVNSTNQLELFFSEPIRAAEAMVAANYLIAIAPGVNITSASVSADARRVYLTISSALTDCNFYTVTANNIHDLAAGSNVAPGGTSRTFWNYGASGLTHRYNFNVPTNSNATGLTVPDSVGGADGVVRNGTGTTTFTGDSVTLSGGDDTIAPYVDLPNGLLSNNSTNRGGTGKVSFEGWMKNTGTFSWARIFDFGSTEISAGLGGEVTDVGGANPNGSGLDYLMLSANNGTDTATRRLELRNEDPAGGGVVTVDHGTTGFNQVTHFVVTWDEATGQLITYENGNQVSTVTTDDAMSAINDVNCWLGRSNWRGDDNLRGEFYEFRVYNTVLAPATVKLDTAGGPDNNFGALLALTLAPATNSVFTNTVGTVQALATFSNAGTQNVALSQCVVYSSSDSNIVYITPDGIAHAVNAGTATITVSLGGLTNSVSIKVIIDAIAPTLLSARARSPREVELIFSEPISVGTATEVSNFGVSSPSAPSFTISVEMAEQLADPSHVVLHLDTDLACEFITITASDIQDQSPLHNTILPGTEIGFMNFVPSGLRHRYTFNHVAGVAAPTTVIPDAVGTADGVLYGNGASFTGERIVFPGGPSATAPFVDLPNGLLSMNSRNNGGSGQVTFEGWVKVTGNRSWSRIFDFGSTGPCCGMGGEITGTGGGGEGIDYLFYSAHNAVDTAVRQIDLTNRDQADHGTVNRAYAITNFNQEFHFVVTWNESTGMINTYEGGVRVATMNTVAAMSEINDVNVWLGRSTWTGDQNLQGEFNEFRVYDRVISTNEIAFNRVIGPDNALGEPVALRVVGTNRVQIGSRLPLATFVDFTAQTNVNLTRSGCVIFQSSDSSVVTNDLKLGLRALALGTSTVTASFNGMSTSIVFTVNYQMQFAGLTPGSSYNVEVAPQLDGPWTTINTQTAGAGGTIDYEDVTARGPQAFYRARLAQ